MNIDQSFLCNSNDMPDLTGYNLVNKKYVHKSNDDNVHIYNVRRALPRIISSDIFENEIPNDITEDEYNYLTKYYLPVTQRTFEDETFIYLLSSLPYQIKIDTLDSIIALQNDLNKNFIKKFYSKNINNKNYTLSEDIDDSDELRLANILDLHSMLITDSEKRYLSEIFEKVTSLDKEEIFYANMFVNPSHNYFFEHNLDHVSGMMVIETARQLFVSISHIFGKAPVSNEVDFILSSLNSSFKDYLLMSYPIRMKLVMDKITYTDKGFWNSVVSNITFIQEYKEKALFNIEGIIMDKNIHDSIVRKKVIKNITTRNNDVCPRHNDIYLKMIHTNNIGFFGSIIDISPKHFIAEFHIPIIFEKIDSFDFKINYMKTIHSQGKCCLEWQHESEERNIVRFKIDEVNDENCNNIIEIIKSISLTREQCVAI